VLKFFKAVITTKEVEGITKHLCCTTKELKECLEHGLMLKEKTSIEAKLANNGNNSTLVLTVSKDLGLSSGPRKFVIDLKCEPLQPGAKLDFLKTLDRFSSHASHCHPNIRVFLNGYGVTKVSGGAEHDSVSTGVPYSNGIHHFVIKIIKCANNYCMVGVQETLAALSPFPGHASIPGVSLYGHNGFCYVGGSYPDYSLGGFGPGDYVGLTLNMRANPKTVTFSINGREGLPKTLTGATYYFIVNVHTAGDSVKLCNNYCYHK